MSALEDWCNDEDFDVYRSWGDEFEVKKVTFKENHLNALLRGGTKNTQVRRINELELDFLKKFRSCFKSFEDCRIGAQKRTKTIEAIVQSGKKPISLYHYQNEAIMSWVNADHIGMLSMATATGKTITALFAIKPFLMSGNPILIVVPNKILIDSWSDTISLLYPNVPILKAGGGFSWKNNENKQLFVANLNKPRIILATMDTASSLDFIEFFKQAVEPVLVADEAHGLGSKIRRNILSLDYKAKLGLSATPERLFDEEGSRLLSRIFGENPVYTLGLGDSVRLSSDNEKKVPILGHFLSPYEYYFYTIDLTKTEQKEWDELTQKIKRLVAIRHSKRKKQPNLPEDDEGISMLLIRRARIVKKAENKIGVVSKILKEKYHPNGKWLVYCEDKIQLDLVSKEISSNFPEIVSMQYYADSSPEKREMVLQYFESNPSIIVSIRCLDEGANIPAADGAIILASSSNPRQYIQRRGRVLRTAKGKKFATIVDVLVLPRKKTRKCPFP